MSFICDKLIELLNSAVSFVKTMFSGDAHENYGRIQYNRGPGAHGSAAPPANNVHTSFDNSTILSHLQCFYLIAYLYFKQLPPLKLSGIMGFTDALAVTGGHGGIHVVNSNLAWQIKLNEAKATRKVMVVDVFASWCGPCKVMAPVFVELSRKLGQQLIFVKVDIDEVPDVPAQYRVVSVPAFLFIRDGQEIDRIAGADRNELEWKCNQYAKR